MVKLPRLTKKGQASTTEAPQTPNRRKKPNKFVVLTVILLIAAAAIIIGFLPNNNAPSLPPEELAKKAIDDLLNQPSMRFDTESNLIIGEDTTKYGEVKGEKSGDNLHAKGEILGSELDIYQIGDTTYRLDEITEEWMDTPGNLALEDSLLLNEINPLTNFKITGILNPQVSSDQFSDEEKCYKISFTPEPANPYFSKFFKEVTYTLWINKDDHQIRKAEISGKSTTNGVDSLLVMTMDFEDFGEDITVEPPVIH